MLPRRKREEDSPPFCSYEREVAECIEGVTVKRETCLRLAIKNSQFEAIKVMVEWILEMEKEDILNLKDELGNTILHLAILIRFFDIAFHDRNPYKHISIAVRASYLCRCVVFHIQHCNDHHCTPSSLSIFIFIHDGIFCSHTTYN
ncbi:hypothetical protein ES332_A11G047900v1 [Gossypium tomentosum]|uniref:Uncharacterized protein n=1 Tax=Gossypium tomentosum TaxID=34277 RepID=A0A5D2N6P1_GOSTO|nr:hypothetical protein ES332_A11G047900v1 [Gossypium tomentosum]